MADSCMAVVAPYPEFHWTVVERRVLAVKPTLKVWLTAGRCASECLLDLGSGCGCEGQASSLQTDLGPLRSFRWGICLHVAELQITPVYVQLNNFLLFRETHNKQAGGERVASQSTFKCSGCKFVSCAWCPLIMLLKLYRTKLVISFLMEVYPLFDELWNWCTFKWKFS